MCVQAATRTFTDIGGSRGAEGKPSRSRPAGAAEGARTIPPPILNEPANAQAPLLQSLPASASFPHGRITRPYMTSWITAADVHPMQTAPAVVSCISCALTRFASRSSRPSCCNPCYAPALASAGHPPNVPGRKGVAVLSERSEESNGRTVPKDEFGLNEPQISLPKGGGVIRSTGEKFAANPMTGTGSMIVPLFMSPGCSRFGPQRSLSYDSGAGHGPLGFGWTCPCHPSCAEPIKVYRIFRRRSDALTARSASSK
jgi:virulence plasmid B protein